MRVVRALLAVVIGSIGCGIVSSAEAAWSKWTSIGGAIVGEPSIVHYGKTSEGVAVAARGLDDAMWVASGPDGIVFGAWKSRGGTINSPPSCVSRQVGIFDCYVRWFTSAIYEIQLNVNWSQWVDHGGQIASNPAALGSFNASTVVYAISVTTLFERSWTDGIGWAPWSAVGEPLPAGTTLECDQSQPGKGYEFPQGFFREYRVLCLFRHADNSISGFEAVKVGQYGGSGYWLSKWQGSLPDIPKSAYRPDVVLTGWSTGEVFVVALDGALWTATWKSGVGFGPWENLGGNFTSGPSCHGRPGADYSMICAGRGGDGAVWVARRFK
jgi:hypothetical protein